MLAGEPTEYILIAHIEKVDRMAPTDSDRLSENSLADILK
jgi:hypothetical protein